MSLIVPVRTFGLTPDGEPIYRACPIDFLDALPGSGEFIGHMVVLKTGSVGLYVWDGGSWIGPLGTGGGGGGAPTTAQYVTLALDGTLTSERVLAVGAQLTKVDGGANGNVTLDFRNMVGSSVLGRVLGTTGAPVDIASVNPDEVLRRDPTGPGIGFGQVRTDGLLDFAVQTAKIDNKAVTFAKMQDLTDQKLLGRGNVGSSGTMGAITLGTNLSMSGSTLNAAGGGGTTPTGTGFRHVTAGVEDAAAKLVDTADVNNDQITDAKLRNSAALSVLGRSANSVGDPADIAATAATDAVLRESGSVLGFGTVATAGIAADAVTDAKLRNSAALTVIGRSANSAGDPADIAASAASDAVLRESGSTVGFGTVATAGIANSAITNAKLADMVQAKVKGRLPGAGTGAPTDIDLASSAPSINKVLIGNSINGTIDEALVGPRSAGVGLLMTNTSGVSAWMAWGTDKTVPIRKAGGVNPAQIIFSGTTFPASPVDGQWFFHETHQYAYVFSSTAGGWLSTNVFEFDFGDTASVASGTYFRRYPIAAAALYSSTAGWRYGFAVKVVGIAVDVGASSTCTITVQDDGANVTGGAISLAAQTSKQDELLMSATIAAASAIGVKCTSGTATTSCSGKVRCQRFET